MKLTFSFTDSANITTLPREDIYDSQFEIPDELKYLIGYETRILAISEMVGNLTDANLHLSCTELGIKHRPIKRVVTERHLRHEFNIVVLYFDRINEHGRQTRQLKIYEPTALQIPSQFFMRRRNRGRARKSLSQNLFQLGDWWCQTDEQRVVAQTITTLANQLLMLLNAEPITDTANGWFCRGFHPWWLDSALMDRLKKRQKAEALEERKRASQEKQRLAKETKVKTSQNHVIETPTTGAGRRYGARPGKFQGVQMRSQLEIRFAAELQERNIQWAYESEVLGEGGYLVDFYLPNLNCWVEVKGQFDARDKYLLLEVAELLERERQQRLFVYMQTKAYIVNSSEFRQISQNEFWDLLFE